MVLLDMKPDCKDVVFVVEASVAMKGHYDIFLKDYILPAIE